FSGRMDSQVKIRGFRVELEEVENRLSAHAEVKETVLQVIDGEHKYLCAYIVAEKPLEAAELREYLARSLPDFMIPAFFIPLEEIPLNPNGKVDRKRLPLPEKDRSQSASTYVAPRTGKERIIVEAWQEVLELDKVGINDNFFEMGGNSLSVIQLHSLLKEALDRDDIAVVDLFTYPTVHTLFNRLYGAGEDTAPRQEEEEAEVLDE
ncbi:MAG: non-ribosomal peptide synthetase, partial [bacterium]|nr:non-ribosomal peptide synthetase [bacterium]